MKKVERRSGEKRSQASSHRQKQGRKSKMIASCGFLENELSLFSKEEGVTLADSVETLEWT